MFLELNQFTLASVRTASLENRACRHGNSRHLVNETHHRVYWRKTVEDPQEGKTDLVQLWEAGQYEIYTEDN